MRWCSSCAIALAWRALRSHTSRFSSMPSHGAGNKAHLLEANRPACFTWVGEVLGQAAVEKHHRLAHRQAILGAAEAQHIHAGPPGDLGRMHAKRRHRIGKARAVHVHAQLPPLGDGRDGAHLLHRETVPTSVDCVSETTRGFG